MPPGGRRKSPPTTRYADRPACDWRTYPAPIQNGNPFLTEWSE